MKKKLLTLFFAITLFSNIWAQDAYLGDIKMFAGNFAPRGWMFCQGQTLNITQNTALYAVIGTTYGGNGQTTFCLPNLSGRVPVGMGNGTNLTPRTIASTGGAETVTLNVNQIPSHAHALTATTATATTNTPSATIVPATAQLPASGATGAKNVNVYAPSSGNPVVTYSTTSIAGGNLSHENMMPFITINYIICVEGLFPTRD